MLKESDVIGKFMSAGGDARQNVRDARIDFTGIGLARNRIAGVKAHLLRDLPVELVDLALVAFEQFQEAGLGSGRALASQEFQGIQHVLQVCQIHGEFLDPERGALAQRRGLRRLEMREGQRRLVFLRFGKIRQLIIPVAFWRDSRAATAKGITTSKRSPIPAK